MRPGREAAHSPPPPNAQSKNGGTMRPLPRSPPSSWRGTHLKEQLYLYLGEGSGSRPGSSTSPLPPRAPIWQAQERVWTLRRRGKSLAENRYSIPNFIKIQGVSKRVLQLYSKCYCVANVTKTLTLKCVQTIRLLRCWWKVWTRFRNSPHSNIWNTIARLFLKHPALPVEVALNRNYPT
jgi:hypothetical protein